MAFSITRRYARIFCVNHDFSILVSSIDGNKENHDRNRVTIDGNGSFDIIMKNIKIFKELSDYLKFSFSVCTDYKTDLLELESFFNKNDLFVEDARLLMIPILHIMSNLLTKIFLITLKKIK